MDAAQTPLRTVRGLDLDQDELSLEAVIESLISTGGQATEVGLARELLSQVFAKRRECDAAQTKQGKPFIFLGYTSNMISSGLRDVFKHLAQHKLVDAIVTTGGGVEEDFIKCQKNTYVFTEFTVNDRQWRVEGKNRIGNMVMPNDNYVEFEEWFSQQYDEMVKEQKKGRIFGPSDLIKYLGERINNESSVYHWCAKNGIEVFSPGVTDGSLGDILYCKGYSDDNFKPIQPPHQTSLVVWRELHPGHQPRSEQVRQHLARGCQRGQTAGGSDCGSGPRQISRVASCQDGWRPGLGSVHHRG